ncbi:uncharacterized protein LOC135496172 isoform X1 [Lineus longissimus]|uniref:uncharacterized protein LOC135496172 isoform X1 n=1 Tax=Lineus longissimus TaxID=88925 RepID=UPI002B4D4202
MKSHLALLMLVLLGLNSSLARPTSSEKAAPENMYKIAANMLLKTSESVQEWGNQVLDVSNSGFTTHLLKELRNSLTSVTEHTNTNLEPYLVMLTVMKSDSAVETRTQPPQSIADEATAMLKEDVAKVVLKDDEKLLLVTGDGESAASTRLRLNVRLFEQIMQRLENTIEDLIDLMSVGDEQDLENELLDFVSEIASESMGLSIVFSGMENSFAQEVTNPSRRQRRSLAAGCPTQHQH